EESYDDRLSKKEETEKRKSTKKFYFSKLKISFINLLQEVDKQQKQGNCDDVLLKNNVCLCYISNQILNYQHVSKEIDPQIIKNAFNAACESHRQYQIENKKQKERRWNAILPEKIIKHLCSQLEKQPQVVLKVLQ